MKLQIAIYLTLTLFVFGTGYFVFSNFYDDSDERTGGLSASKNQKQEIVAAAPQSLLVKSVEGNVERSSVTKEKWMPVLPGNELYVDERIRTDKNSSVKLQADDKSRIELDGQSEISIQEITDTVHRIRLELGKLDVDYKPSKTRRLKITNAEKGGEAETQSGQFVIQNNNGKLSVATEKGEVAFTGANKTVTVGPGKLSYIMEGGTPAKPEPIPLSVMLRVANPKKLRQTEKSTLVKGKTDATARVQVNEEEASVDKNGNFQIKVPLAHGKNKIHVVATTTYGSTQKDLPTIVVSNSVYTNDTPTTIERAEVKWGTKKKKRKTKKTSNAE